MSKPKKEKSQCSGCRNNDYNFGLGGANGCWSFKSGKIIKRLRIPIDLPPPYNKENADWIMDCYQKRGYVFVGPKVLNSDGFWKS